MKVTLALPIAASMLVLGAWSVGCSSSSGDVADDAGTAEGGAAQHDSGTAGTDCAATDGSDMTPFTDDVSCSKAGSKSACTTCCQKGHEDGVKYLEQQVLDCECTSPGACKTECAATYCAATSSCPDTACASCMSGNLDADAGGVCRKQVDLECYGNQGCVDYMNCLGLCP